MSADLGLWELIASPVLMSGGATGATAYGIVKWLLTRLHKQEERASTLETKVDTLAHDMMRTAERVRDLSVELKAIEVRFNERLDDALQARFERFLEETQRGSRQ